MWETGVLMQFGMAWRATTIVARRALFKTAVSALVTMRQIVNENELTPLLTYVYFSIFLSSFLSFYPSLSFFLSLSLFVIIFS